VNRVLPDSVPLRYTNAVRCIFDPRSKKDPSVYIDKCRDHLLAEIEETQPSRIIAFGSVAFQSLIGESVPITQVVGGWGYTPFFPDIPVQFAIHPSAQLHNDAIGPYWRRTTGRMLEVPPPDDWDGPDGMSTIVVRNVMRAVKILDLASLSDLCAYDIEYNPTNNKMLCLSIAFSPNIAYVFPHTILQDYLFVDALERLFMNTQMVAHNWKFDAWGSVKGMELDPNTIIDSEGYWMDTSTMRKLHNPEQESKLDLAEWLVGMGGHKGELTKLFGKSRNGNAYEKAYNDDPDVVMRYCGGDSIACYRLALLYEELLREDGLWPLWEETFGPLGKALFSMENIGMRIDKHAMDALDKRLIESMDIELKAIRSDSCIKRLCKNWDIKDPKKRTVTSDNFNPKSDRQMRELMFSVHGLGLKPREKDKTKGGAHSVSKDVVAHHNEKNPSILLGHLAEFNRVKHKHSTYVKGYRRRIAEDGCLHTDYRQDVARTQRLSSRDPNLQNIPNRGHEEDRSIRRMFLPVNDDEYLLELDYSQMELREAADLSNDPVMVDCFINGVDIHKKTASEILGCSVDEVSKDARRKAKPINFGVTFGMKEKKLRDYAKTDYGVDLTDAEAVQWLKGFFRLYAGYKVWMLKELMRAQKQGCAYVYWCGKIYSRRWLTDLGSGNIGKRLHAERQVWNTPIQGGASLYTLKSAIIAEDKIYAGEMPGVTALVHTIHDSLIFSVKKDAVEDAFRMLGSVMVGLPTIRVPLEIEGKAGPNLADMEEIGKLDSREV
jgi:DNA polymerase I-like protein with 3'-5' exonuclease and polymerase domains